MATAQTHLAFDTLACTQALIARVFQQKQAEALAVVTRDFVISRQTTNAFVQNKIRDAKSEIKHGMALLKLAIGKMLAAAVGTLLAGILIVLDLLQKMG